MNILIIKLNYLYLNTVGDELAASKVQQDVKILFSNSILKELT